MPTVHAARSRHWPTCSAISLERGLLAVEDPLVAASQFNWLVMGEPLNNAMLLGDAAIPSRDQIRGHCAAAVRTFLAAYAPRSSE